MVLRLLLLATCRHRHRKVVKSHSNGVDERCIYESEKYRLGAQKSMRCLTGNVWIAQRAKPKSYQNIIEKLCEIFASTFSFHAKFMASIWLQFCGMCAFPQDKIKSFFVRDQFSIGINFVQRFWSC